MFIGVIPFFIPCLPNQQEIFGWFGSIVFFRFAGFDSGSSGLQRGDSVPLLRGALPAEVAVPGIAGCRDWPVNVQKPRAPTVCRACPPPQERCQIFLGRPKWPQGMALSYNLGVSFLGGFSASISQALLEAGAQKPSWGRFVGQ